METKEKIEAKELLKNSKPLNINCLNEEMADLIVRKLGFAMNVINENMSPAARCKEIDDLLVSEVRVHKLIQLYKPGIN